MELIDTTQQLKYKRVKFSILAYGECFFHVTSNSVLMKIRPLRFANGSLGDHIGTMATAIRLEDGCSLSCDDNSDIEAISFNAQWKKKSEVTG